MSAAKKLIQGEALYNGDRIQILDVITFAGRVEVMIAYRTSDMEIETQWVQFTDLVQVVWFA